MPLVFVGGVNGAGKTAIAEELGKNPAFHAISGSAGLMDRLGIARGDYAALRQFPEEVKRDALVILLEELAQGSPTRTTLFTGHFVKVLDGEITPSYGAWYGSCTCLVLVLCPASLILKRIERDEATKHRTSRSLFGGKYASEADRVGFLEFAQRRSAEVMAQASREFGVPCVRIVNFGTLEDSATRLASALGRGL